MKKLINASLVLAIFAFLVMISYSSSAQKKFRGILTTQYSYTGMDAATMAQLPKIKTVMIYDNLIKEITDYGMAQMAQILNGDTKTVTLLIDQGAEKKYIKLSTEETKELAEKVTDVKINYFDETKSIAGYTCKKAIVNYKNEDGAILADTVFYSEELGGEALNFGSKFEGLKGFPVEYKVREGELTISITVSEVKKGKVKDTDFLIPSEYVEMTPEEKAQIMQQSGDDE
jgi:hypothetical protein